jgi:hypothetical protein
MQFYVPDTQEVQFVLEPEQVTQDPVQGYLYL